jgi:hypothetical protein
LRSADSAQCPALIALALWTTRRHQSHPYSGATPVAVVKTRTKGRKGRWPRSHEGLAGAAPTGHDDEHSATFAFKVGQQARVAATRIAHTWPGQATSRSR